jgi:hypothetical protein
MPNGASWRNTWQRATEQSWKAKPRLSPRRQGWVLVLMLGPRAVVLKLWARSYRRPAGRPSLRWSDASVPNLREVGGTNPESAAII